MMPSTVAEPTNEEHGWPASLKIDLGLRAGLTRPTYVSHLGPLRIQRPFYPEDDGTCHLVLLHPPGGVVGGDTLTVRVDSGPGCRALFTTPAATKLYRCSKKQSALTQEVSAQGDAFCEWLPQETIAFNGALSEISTRFRLEGEAQLIGWEILCLGRPAIGEGFEKGQLVQTLELYRDGRPLLLDRLSIGRGPCARLGRWGLGGNAVVGTMMLSGRTDGLISAWRTNIPELELRNHFASTELEGCVVLRYLGDQVSDCWKVFNRAWEIARPLMGRIPPSPPRIWKC